MGAHLNPRPDVEPTLLREPCPAGTSVAVRPLTGGLGGRPPPTGYPLTGRPLIERPLARRPLIERPLAGLPLIERPLAGRLHNERPLTGGPLTGGVIGARHLVPRLTLLRLTPVLPGGDLRQEVLGPARGHRLARHRVLRDGDLVRQPDGERAAASHRRGQRHRSPHEFGELLDHRQADAGTLPAARSGTTRQLGEPLEHARVVLGGDTDAGVADGEAELRPAVGQADHDRTAPGVLQRVGEQVEHDALVHVAIEDGMAGQVRAVDHELQPGALHRRGERRSQRPGERADLDDAGLRTEPAGLHPAEVEHRVHHPGQPDDVAFDQPQSFPQGRGERLARIGQGVGDRAGDQRQRRPQFVADVGEEVRLRGVHLHQQVGAAPLLGEFAHATEGGGDARRTGLQVVAELVVPHPMRVLAHQQHRGRTLVARLDHRDRVHRMDRRLQARLGRRGGLFEHETARRPVRRRCQSQRLGSLGPPGRVRGWGVQQDLAVLGGRDPADRHEGMVPRVRGEDGDRRSDHVVGVGESGQLIGELGQGRQSPLGQHLLGGFGEDAEDAAHPVLVRNGAVGEGEVALLGRDRAVEQTARVRCPGGGPAGHQPGHHRTRGRPRLRPHLGRRRPQRPRVAGVAEDRPARVVVEDGELFAPPDRDREAGGHAHRDRGPQRLGPLRQRAQRGAGPVEVGDPGTHLAAEPAQPGGPVGVGAAGSRLGPGVGCVGFDRRDVGSLAPRTVSTVLRPVRGAPHRPTPRHCPAAHHDTAGRDRQPRQGLPLSGRPAGHAETPGQRGARRSSRRAAPSRDPWTTRGTAVE